MTTTVKQLFDLFMVNPEKVQNVVSGNGRFSVEVYIIECYDNFTRLFIANTAKGYDKWQCVYSLSDRVNGTVDWWEKDKVRLNGRIIIQGKHGIMVEINSL